MVVNESPTCGADDNQSQQQQQLQHLPSEAVATVTKLLGSVVVCTLTDGRVAKGTLVCIDRLKNIILADCVETRTIVSTDYNSEPHEPVAQPAQRFLQQAMVPGAHLVRVEIDIETYRHALKSK